MNVISFFLLDNHQSLFIFYTHQSLYVYTIFVYTNKLPCLKIFPGGINIYLNKNVSAMFCMYVFVLSREECLYFFFNHGRISISNLHRYIWAYCIYIYIYMLDHILSDNYICRYISTWLILQVLSIFLVMIERTLAIIFVMI